MDVNLIDYTGIGSSDPLYAARVLVFTKQTRLNMDPDRFTAVLKMPEEDVLAELNYMAETIKSSWEFVNMTFLIRGISRACAQQFTRTRNASYAMQSQRVTNVSKANVIKPSLRSGQQSETWDAAVTMAKASYDALIGVGVSLEDARGLLPINTECNIVASYNLRSLTSLIKARSSMRVQGEYQELIARMKDCMLTVWPWTKPFLLSKNEAAVQMADRLAAKLRSSGNNEDGWQAAKIADMIRNEE